MKCLKKFFRKLTPRTPATEETLTMAPVVEIRWGRQRRLKSYGATTWTSNILRIISLSSCFHPPTVTYPALLIRPSILPNVSSVCLTRRDRTSASAMSPRTRVGWIPRGETFLHCSAMSSSRSFRLPWSVSFAPFEASNTAVVAPIPADEPSKRRELNGKQFLIYSHLQIESSPVTMTTLSSIVLVELELFIVVQWELSMNGEGNSVHSSNKSC